MGVKESLYMGAKKAIGQWLRPIAFYGLILVFPSTTPQAEEC